MPVLITTDCRDSLPVNLDAVTDSARRLLRLCGQEHSEWSILLVDDQRMATLNEEYRHKQGPTNVLAFALREGEALTQPTRNNRHWATWSSPLTLLSARHSNRGPPCTAG